MKAEHPKENRSHKKSDTDRHTRSISTWIPELLRGLKTRERLLPQDVLQACVRTFLSKRDVLLESAARFGTPQYFLDEPAFSKQLAAFHETFSRYLKRCRVFYAVKSNSFEGLCRSAVNAGMGLDVSSGFELSMGLSIGCKKIVFTGPGKTEEELILAIRNRRWVTLILDSFGELQRVSELLRRERNDKALLMTGIRVRTKQQGIWNKFGIPLEDLEFMLGRISEEKRAQARGIQFHTSWNLQPSKQVEMIKRIGDQIRKHVPESLREALSFLDIGGGFWPEQGEWLNPENTTRGRLIQIVDPLFRFKRRHYLRESKPIDEFARAISEAIRLQGAPLNRLEIWMEPGRWISTPAMHILLGVVDKKDSETVITDGGTNLLGWERPLTEFIPVINLTRPAMEERPLKVFGSLCTPHDVWGNSVFGNGIEEGDVIAIPDQGAYTYSLRQSFIKPRSRVIRYDGESLEEVEMEEKRN